MMILFDKLVRTWRRSVRASTLTLKVISLQALARSRSWAIDYYDIDSRVPGATSHFSGPRRFPGASYIVDARCTDLVAGTRYIVAKRNVASDEVSHFASVTGWLPKLPNHFRIRQRHLCLDLHPSPTSELDGGIHMMHEYSYNYFHFIAEVLPKLRIATTLADPSMPLLIDAGLHPNIHQMIKVFAADRPLIELGKLRRYRAKRLLFLSDLSSVQDVDDRKRAVDETSLAVDLIRMATQQVMEAVVPGMTGRCGRKIYARRGSRLRAVLNEATVEAFLEKEGFDVIDTESMSLAEQIRTFHDACLVVAPTGAALANIVWCQAGTEVIILSADHIAMPDDVWMQLGQVSHCRVRLIRGAAVNASALHDNFVAPVEVLRDVLATLTIDGV